MKRQRSLLFAASSFSTLLAACSGAPTGGAPEPERTGEAATAITGATVLANGEQWVNAKLHYCQAAYGMVDYDSSCWAWEGPSHVCARQSNAAWNAYRSDCSGFITWAWGLPPVGDGGYVTSDFAPFATGFSQVIQASELLPGDAANKTAGGHIVLFRQWVTPGSEAVFLEEPGCSSSEPYAHEFTSAVTLSGSSIYIAYEGESFTAIRWKGLATAPPDWAASFAAQSWPFASTTMKMTVNQVLPASITLKNTGAKTWDANTRLGTTQPRDRTSAFAGADWLAPNRLAALPKGVTVAPGGSYEFKFSFHAPGTPGTFDEFYDLVQEGVAWFSDPGQGGPPDNDLEAKIQVDEAAYHGEYLAQTFPTLQQAPLMMKVGQSVTGNITVKNVGTATWKAGVTKLAPTPRDKPSPLASPSWLSPTRVSSPPSDVPPGASYAFSFELTAGTAGTFTQTFALVEEGVTWFADAPQGGGPPDDLLAVHVIVTEQAGTSSSSSGGGSAGTSGAPAGAGGGGGYGGSGTGAMEASAEASSSGGTSGSVGASSACTLGATGGGDWGLLRWASVVGVLVAVGRRRRRHPLKQLPTVVEGCDARLYAGPFGGQGTSVTKISC
jgi:hypothetical protein